MVAGTSANTPIIYLKWLRIIKRLLGRVSLTAEVALRRPGKSNYRSAFLTPRQRVANSSLSASDYLV